MMLVAAAVDRGMSVVLMAVVGCLMMAGQLSGGGISFFWGRWFCRVSGRV